MMQNPFFHSEAIEEILTEGPNASWIIVTTKVRNTTRESLFFACFTSFPYVSVPSSLNIIHLAKYHEVTLMPTRAHTHGLLTLSRGGCPTRGPAATYSSRAASDKDNPRPPMHCSVRGSESSHRHFIFCMDRITQTLSQYQQQALMRHGGHGGCVEEACAGGSVPRARGRSALPQHRQQANLCLLHKPSCPAATSHLFSPGGVWLWTVPPACTALCESPGSEMGAGDTAPGGRTRPAERVCEEDESCSSCRAALVKQVAKTGCEEIQTDN